MNPVKPRSERKLVDVDLVIFGDKVCLIAKVNKQSEIFEKDVFESRKKVVEPIKEKYPLVGPSTAEEKFDFFVRTHERWKKVEETGNEREKIAVQREKDLGIFG